MENLLELEKESKESQESFEDWWEAFLESLREDKDTYIINGVEY